MKEYRLTPYGNKAFKIEELKTKKDGTTVWKDHSYPGNIEQAAQTLIHLHLEGSIFDGEEALVQLKETIEDCTKRIVNSMKALGSSVTVEKK